MEKLKVLLIEDEPYHAHQLEKFISDFCIVSYAAHRNQALYFIENNKFDVALIDLNLTHQQDLQGFKLLSKTKEQGIYSIVLSSVNDPTITKEAYKLGCDHFLSKDQYRESLLPYLKSFQKRNSTFCGLEKLEKIFITNDPDLKRDIVNLLNVNLKNQCLFLSGETGVGKSFFAKTFHQLLDSNSPFVSFNCSQVPESLIDSEIFGYRKGAFTGAEKDHQGILERANEGTLFLDEIGAMPLYTQQKLLKAIEEKEFTPLGATKPIKVNFTLISATCEDLQTEIQTGRFRQDFYYRIAGYELNIPPLRKRKNDIELLIYHFLSTSPRKFFMDEEVIKNLKENSWIGNTRELKKLIETLSRSNLGIINLDCPYLPQIKQLPSSDLLTQEQRDSILQNGLTHFIKSVEQCIFKDVMKKEQGKVTKVIESLQISNSTYYRILKESE